MGSLVLLLANASLLYGWLTTPPGTRFLGLRTVVPADTPVYYAYLRQIQSGESVIYDRYTAEPQPVGTFNIVWLTLGRLGGWFGLSAPATFHLSRAVLGGLLLYILWVVVRWWLDDGRERLAAWLLMLSSGVGFLLTPWLPAADLLNRAAGYRWPVDLWLPWVSPIASLGQSPHLVASWLLLVAVLVLVVAAVERQRFRLALVAGVGAAALINFHPYHGPTLLAVAAAWLALAWVASRRIVWSQLVFLLPLVVGTLASLSYHRWLLSVSPVLAARAAQNFTRLPPWPLVVAGLGLVVPLALAGLRTRWRDPRGRLCISWVLASALLVSWPSQFQARYLQGAVVPLAVISAPVLVRILTWCSRRAAWLGVAGGGLLAAVLLYATPVAIAVRDVQAYRGNPAAHYFPEEFFAAAAYLERTVQPAESVLASHDSALILGGFANVTLYFGHGDETVNSAAKRRLVEAFYLDGNATVRRQLLTQMAVRYVWEGWLEQQLGGPPVAGVPGVHPVFRNAQVTIYRFTPDGG